MEAMFTIAPPPLASMAGIWNFMPRNVPRMLVAIPRSNSVTSMSASGAGSGPSVALLNAASSRPSAACLDASGDGLQGREVAGAQDDRRAGGRECVGGGRADSLAGTGYQGYPAVHRQVTHRCSPLVPAVVSARP